MKTNEKLQFDVQETLKWEPLLQAAEIGVSAKDGIVTLSGTVDNYIKKTEAEEAARHVAGVKGIVDEIEVRFAHSHKKSDQEIAADALNRIAASGYVPEDRIQVKVENGNVYLSGEVAQYHQKAGAATAIKGAAGVKSIFTQIVIKNEAQDTLDKFKILDAFQRHANLDADNIYVTVSNGEVTLKGSVKSLYEKDQAAKAAWKAPGISHVDNQLLVESQS